MIRITFPLNPFTRGPPPPTCFYRRTGLATLWSVLGLWLCVVRRTQLLGKPGNTSRRCLLFVTESTGRGVAVDPVSRRVFYTVSGDNAYIAFLTLPNDTETVVVNSGVGEPHAIALDTTSR